jgi:translocator protein
MRAALMAARFALGAIQIVGCDVPNVCDSDTMSPAYLVFTRRLRRPTTTSVTTQMITSTYPSLIAFFAITFVAALTGAMFMPGPWYKTLLKPTWTPPNWVFGPAWTVLYFLIAVAGWRVYRAVGWHSALVFWLLQLVLNAAWSWLMFGQKRIDLALIDVVALWLSIAAFIVVARPIDQTASFLFVPYLAWVTFATVLNAAIWRLNGSVPGLDGK